MTNSVSPASGSVNLCSMPGLASGTETLASDGSVMLHRDQRQRRRADGVGKGQRPGRAPTALLAGQRGKLRPVETDAHRLALRDRQAVHFGNQRATLAADGIGV